MGVEIHVAGTQDEAAAQLKRIPAQAMLLVAGRPGASPGLRVIAAKKVQDVGLLQARRAIRFPLLVNQQGEGDAGFIAEKTGVAPVAESHSGQAGSLLLEFLLVFAQLRNVLAAEQSPIVAQENENPWLPFPKRSEPDLMSVGIRQDDAGQRLAERAGHVTDSIAG
jgi:hypothetical protein